MTEQTEQPAPRRLRSQDVIDQQAATIDKLLTRGGGERSSVEFTRNAKGETQIAVTVRGDDHTLTTADLVYAKATELYDAACAKFPAGTGFVRNEGQS